MAYSSSAVTKGRAVGIAIATGMNSEVGRIAELLRGKNDGGEKGFLSKVMSKVKRTMKNILGLVGTPLQVKLSKFALVLFGLAILLAIIVFSANKVCVIFSCLPPPVNFILVENQR
jgi:magnesium-transporting ATPase (P-type)